MLKKDKKDYSNYIIILILIIAAAMRIIFNPMDIDDAMIGYRVIENIASGNGFEYNSGEKVLSTTSPLHVLIISFLRYIGISPIIATNSLSLLSALVTIFLVYLILKHFDKEKAGLLAAGILSINNDFIIYTMNGMETSFYTMLWVLSIYFFIKKRYSLTGIILGLLVFTRLDGAVLAVSLGLLYLYYEKKIPWKMAIIALLIFLPWVIYATCYFGNPIPNTLKAKQLQAGGTTSFPIRLFAFLYDESFLLIIPFILISLSKMLKNKYWPIYAGSLLYIVAYTTIMIPGYMWYYIPLTPIIAILAGIGLDYVTKKIFSKNKLFYNLFLISIFTGLLCTSYLGISHYKQKVDPKWVSYRNVGKWLNENTNPNDTIMFHDIGYVGYYSKRYIWDYNLLVHKQDFHTSNKLNYTEFMQEHNPDYVIYLKTNVLGTIDENKPNYPGYKVEKTFTDHYDYRTDDLRYELEFLNYYYIFKKI